MRIPRRQASAGPAQTRLVLTVVRTTELNEEANATLQEHGPKGHINYSASNYSFCAIAITAYLNNGGTLEKAAQTANHPSARKTQRYDAADAMRQALRKPARQYSV
jgi:hypothetical protein